MVLVTKLFSSWLIASFFMLGLKGPVAVAQSTADKSDLKQTPASAYVSQEILNLFIKYGKETSSFTSEAVSAAQANREVFRRQSGQISELNTAVQRISEAIRSQTESLRQLAEELAAQRTLMQDVMLVRRTQQTIQPTTNNTEKLLSSEIRNESQKTRLEISVALNYSREVNRTQTESLRVLSRQLTRVSNVVGLYTAGTSLRRLRLANGNRTGEGRVELLLVSEGGSDRWGTVCDDNFDNVDATVVCYSLGYGRVGRSLNNAYGPGSGDRDTIVLDDLACTGTESTLLDCPHYGIFRHNCNHGEDVSVSCVSS